MDQPSGLINASADFPEVDRLFHVAYFVPVNWGEQDRVSRSIIDFQHNRDPQKEQWVRLAETLAGPLRCDTVVRALSSKESTSNGKTPLDILCHRLAQRTGAQFAPERLWKVRRAGPVKNSGGRKNRLKILHLAYEFDASGLDPNARILLVDDIVTTGATLKTIAGAIRQELPDATITALTLARTDPHLVQMHLGESVFAPLEETAAPAVPNPHLDEQYFYRSVAPPTTEPRSRPAPPPIPAVLPQPAERPTKAPPVRVSFPPPVPPPVDKVFGEEDFTPLTATPTRPEPASSVPPIQTPVRENKQKAVQSGETTINPLVYAIGAAAVIFVVFFLITLNSNEPRPQSNIPPAEEQATPVATQREAPPAPPPRAPRKLPPVRHGTVTVPLIGLRSGPSLDSTALPGVVLEGERVTILKTENPETGPAWIQIRKEDGSVGWVFSGVIAPDSASGISR